LDVLSEDKINDILLELKGQKTIISIAHRLQILKHCDRVIYMDNGKIIDIDTFSNLNDKYEEFRKIIELSNFQLR
ncbi:ABC transporter ATP-binding protein, partial [bacterium]|nr:ABC transporter ATP-binding protein [bacterium]